MGGVGKKMSTQKNRSSMLGTQKNGTHRERNRHISIYYTYIHSSLGGSKFQSFNKKNVLSEETHLSKYSVNQAIWCTPLASIVKDLFCGVWYFYFAVCIEFCKSCVTSQHQSLEPVFLMTDPLYVNIYGRKHNTSKMLFHTFFAAVNSKHSRKWRSANLISLW